MWIVTVFGMNPPTRCSWSSKFQCGHGPVRWSAESACASRGRTRWTSSAWPRRSPPKTTRPRATADLAAHGLRDRRAHGVLPFVGERRPARAGRRIARSVRRSPGVECAVAAGGAGRAPRLARSRGRQAMRRGLADRLRCARSTRGPRFAGRGRAADTGSGHGGTSSRPVNGRTETADKEMGTLKLTTRLPCVA